ncbi:MAG TPA: hypothetical protein VN706_18590 [Gemmatimonadaceae bacterium]|nr:hypothetical protein [Gemmatimonadaceae bacterium]
MIAALLLTALIAKADTNADSSATCKGERVSAVSINARRPSFGGSASKWRTIAHALGLHHVTTRSGVIRAFSFVHPGDECTTQRMQETERVLRALPFLADASVRAVPSDSGMVAVEIETTDEVPVLAAGGLRHAVPTSFSVGNENLFGLGTMVDFGIGSNSPYRTSGFVRGSVYGVFGSPTLATANATRERLGDHVDLALSRLLLSDLQRVAWNATYRAGDDFPIVVRPVGDDQSVEVHDHRWSVGTIHRVNFGATPFLIGPVVLGNSISPASTSIVVSDSGAVVQRDSALLARFQPFHAMRLGALVGARRVRFVTRNGFDALFAPQDLMVGWQAGTLAAPSLTHDGGHDFLLAPSIYVGAASRRTAILADLEGEARREFDSGTTATIANVHATAYVKPSERLLLSAEDNFSVIDRAALPTQLTMSDALGGPRGFAGSPLLGARRDVLRLEARFAVPALVHRADLGVALFADAGWIDAGNVPFGTTGTAHSVGFSLIGAYPTRSKHTYRLDVAFPTGGTGGTGIHRVQVRFINGDPTSNFAVEPGDVTQARMAPVPSSLFTWPGR